MLAGQVQGRVAVYGRLFGGGALLKEEGDGLLLALPRGIVQRPHS